MFLLPLSDEEAVRWTQAAAEAALSATCGRSRCGSVIVNRGRVVGVGFNSPPAGAESQRRCGCEKSSLHPKVTDKTCCVHAEQRAVMDALRRNPDALAGSRLYFVRLDGAGRPKCSGEPYCTVCSKMALDAGVAEFVLMGGDGFRVYGTEEYNVRSFAYAGEPPSGSGA